MNYDTLKQRVAKEINFPKKDVSLVLDATINEILRAFIHTDTVELGPLGTMEFQYIPPSTSSGVTEYTGRIRFKIHDRALRFLVQKNMDMIELEERES